MSDLDNVRREPRATLSDVHTILYHDGERHPCTLRNLSATGMLLETRVDLTAGTDCSLGMRLSPALEELATVDHLTFHLEVLGNEPAGADVPDMRQLRCRIETSAGSELQDRARRLVYQALGIPES